ncbi:DUF1806 family protein [Natribacillus halophilus]|uniref:DUF1806 family protein n=1 Tax=Natribacillus halophilus TaxID=549003 RepID=A0A1G8Q1M5_9BACI|nr:DUF1806 family protein [Natribacillus halophilus]SDI98639.1 Protein of unknown function [Natribacillus halophilus]
MKNIQADAVQTALNTFKGQQIYVHFELTNGAYAAYRHGKFQASGGFVRNARVNVLHGKISGDDPFRVGLKTEDGWIFAEGLTAFEEKANESLYLYGLDEQGKLSVALQLSTVPFEEGVDTT